MSVSTVHVAVGVIINTKHEVLISKRSAGVHQANRWEFPGGKIEQNEKPEEALYRELKEELGIDANESEFLSSIDHDYGDKVVCLHTYIINHFSGTPVGVEGQPVQWVKINDLKNYHFPEANIAIINALQLPDIIQITGAFSSLDDLILKSQNCIDKGIRLLQFRAHELNDLTYIEYAALLLRLCQQHGVKLTLNRTLEVFKIVGADGLHLNRYEMKKFHERPCSKSELFSVSCHSEEELMQAEKLSVDYCFLSPVKSACSHDAGPELGAGRFSVLTNKYALAIYALGGMTKSDLEKIKNLKGKGIATISDNWQ